MSHVFHIKFTKIHFLAVIKKILIKISFFIFGCFQLLMRIKYFFISNLQNLSIHINIYIIQIFTMSFSLNFLYVYAVNFHF